MLQRKSYILLYRHSLSLHIIPPSMYMS